MNFLRTALAGGALGAMVSAVCSHFGFSSANEWELIMGSAIFLGCFI